MKNYKIIENEDIIEIDLNNVSDKQIDFILFNNEIMKKQLLEIGDMKHGK